MLENVDRMLSAIQSLPAMERQVIELRYLQNMDEREIGMLLGADADTVQSRLFRARWNLAQKLQEIHV